MISSTAKNATGMLSLDVFLVELAQFVPSNATGLLYRR